MTTSRRALPFVFVATIGSTSAHAQHLTCYPIRTGDTAARLAERLTGDPRNRYQPWFQIVEPLTAGLIPKQEYRHIEPGWHVCVASERLRTVLARPAHYRAFSSSGAVVQGARTPQPPRVDLSVVLWAAPATVLLAGVAVAWSLAGKYAAERRVTVAIMRGFGNRFVDEFERPLFRRRPVESALDSRLRFAPYRRRLEVLLAPTNGHTYPNLSDHRKNVEYDVERVLTVLNDAQFVNEPLYTEGRWVVIPLRVNTRDMH